MGSLKQGFLAALALAGALTFSNPAHAVQPLPKGKFKLSAERLASSSIVIANGASWHNQLLGAPGDVPIETPRLGADYFVIDGLSIGGHVGIGLYVPDGGRTQGYLAVLPRVGYAFSLSDKFDFWPRVSAGFAAYGNNTAGLIGLEGMFLYNLKDWFAIEFGPAIDIPLSNFSPDVVMGANAGFVVTF